MVGSRVHRLVELAASLAAASLIGMMAPSVAWAEDCEAYATSAIDQSAEYRELSCSGGLTEWWNETRPYHANWCHSLPADSPLPANGTRDREAVLSACRDAARAAEPGVPRIATLPEQIERCRRLSGDERDLCMVQLVFREENPALCAEIPESRCAAIIGATLMEKCQGLSDDDERLVCETAVANETGAVEACKGASQRPGCVAAIAAKRGSPDVIFTAFEPGPERDFAISMLASELRDPAVVELITDNRAHDKALVSIAAAIGIRNGETLPREYCDRLRGGYDDLDGEGEASIAQYCRVAVAITNFAVTQRNMAETEAEYDGIKDALRAMSEALGRQELSPDQLEELLAR